MILVSDIQSSVAQLRNFTRADILRRGAGHKALWRARHEAVYLARALTPHSYPALAKMFGGRDHTTLISAMNRVTERLSSEPELRAELAMLAYFAEPIR